MRLAKTSNLSKPGDIADNLEGYVTGLDKDVFNLFLAMKGRIRFGEFGTGDALENISGQWLQITTNASADTETAFSHSLGAVPQGYIVVSRDKPGVIYDGTTSWTSSNIYLRSDVTSVTANLILLK